MEDVRNAERGAVLPWQVIEVSGPSMVPTLRHGDLVVVRRGASIRPGDVVLATFRAMPERLVIKRAVRPQDGGWWLCSDNEFVGGDSRIHGVADVAARVVLRFRAREDVDGGAQGSAPSAAASRVWRSPSRVRRTDRS
jgi:hypothetical protein